jgi:hypothetical protein
LFGAFVGLLFTDSLIYVMPFGRTFASWKMLTKGEQNIKYTPFDSQPIRHNWLFLKI